MAEITPDGYINFLYYYSTILIDNYDIREIGLAKLR